MWPSPAAPSAAEAAGARRTRSAWETPHGTKTRRRRLKRSRGETAGRKHGKTWRDLEPKAEYQ